MSSPLAAVSLILAAVLLTILSFRSNPEGVETAYQTVDKLRWVGGLIFIGVAGYHLVYSDNYLYYGVAALFAGFLTAYLVIERPWDPVI